MVPRRLAGAFAPARGRRGRGGGSKTGANGHKRKIARRSPSDSDNRVAVLAFSDERAGLHALLRLDAEDGAPLGFLLGEGVLAGALVPGLEGARRLIREADGTVRVDDVAEGPGDLAGPLWGLALAMRARL